MGMRKFAILWMGLSFLVSACHESPQKNEIGEKILFERSEVIGMADLFGNRKYVPLETKDDCLLMEITQLLCTRDKIFIFDLYSQTIFVFDYAGQFLHKLHRVGQGPGEYAMISSMSVDEGENLLSVTEAGNRVLQYDLNTLDYVGDVPMDALSIEKAGDGGFWAYNSLPVLKDDVSYEYHLLRYDKMGNVEHAFLPIDLASGYIMRPIYRFYQSDNHLCFYPPFTSRVYELEQDTCLARYTLEYENLSYPPLEQLKDWGEHQQNYVDKLRDANFIYSMQLFENKGNFVSLFNVGRDAYIGIYNKAQRKGKYFQRKSYVSPSDQLDYYQIIGSRGNCLISVLKSSEILKQQSLIDEDLKDIREELEEDSNPVLLFATLNASL